MLYSGVLLFLTLCLLDVKSDQSQLPIHRRALNPVSELMRDNQSREQINVQLGTADLQAITENNLISEYHNLIQDRNEFIRDIQNQAANQQHARTQQEQNQLNQALNTVTTFANNRNPRETEEEHRRYRRLYLHHLEMVYDIQERILIRYQLEILLRHIDINRQKEHEQRAQEIPTQNQRMIEHRLKERQVYDKLEQSMQKCIQDLDKRITQVQPLAGQHLTMLDNLEHQWTTLQTLSTRMDERRAHERILAQQQLAREQLAQKNHVQEQLSQKVQVIADKRQRPSRQ